MASINELDHTLKEILKVLQTSAKAGGTAGQSGGSAPGGKTLKDHFTDAFKKGSEQGLGIQKAAGNIAGKIGGLAGQGASVTSGLGMGGAIGAIGGPLIAFGAELAKLPGQVREFAEGLHQANRQFAQFSPSMAMVMAQSDMRDAMRKMQQGEQLAASAGGLAEARGRLEDQLAPIDTQWQRLQNRFGEAITGGMATFFEKSDFGKQATELLKQAGDFIFGEEPPAPPDEWLKELDKMVKDEQNKINMRTEPVRKTSKDPRPGFPWDRRAAGGDF